MNQAKLTKWIEQAEERAVCELARAEPGLVKLSLSPTDRAAARLHVTELMRRLAHPFGVADHMRRAA
jgi:hypothetical protein